MPRKLPHYWEIQLSADGTLFFIFDSGGTEPGHLGTVDSSIPINDGTAHQVEICRPAGIFTIFTDGHLSVMSQWKVAFGDLAPLHVATSPCPAFPPFGGVTDVCLGGL